MEVGRCLDSDTEAIDPNLPEMQVAQRLAQYDLLAIAVVDDGGRLLGAVTVDDIIDHLLPRDWRRGR
jgi:Mg/Co/Ni transporter MgtE